MHLGKDLKEFVGLLRFERVKFLVVGAAAVAVHGRPRYTGDVDFWIECSPLNAANIIITAPKVLFIRATKRS